jgi:hypothetical protein
VTTRFQVDLLHPGWVAQSWQDWFVGPKGTRRLAMFAVGCAALLVVVLVAVILPTRWRLASDLNAVPGLRRDLAARESDLTVLRSNLQALGDEARRQVRWAELLTTLSQQTPPALKLQVVEAARVVPPAAQGQAAAASAKPENTIRIDAVTPLRPGSPPLVEIAQFMAGLMRDPTISKRFQLKTWEIKPGAAAAAGGVQLLNVSITLSERGQ